MKTVLVIAPHPDDETIGCGGTILKLKAQGCKVCWLLVTNISQEHGWSADVVSRRQQEIETVSQRYGFDGLYKLDYPTTRLDTIAAADLIDSMSRVIREIQPDTVYLPNRSDIHSDHRVVFHAAMSCTKHFRYPFLKKVLMYETLSETEYAPAFQDTAFVPNVFVDISKHIQDKLNILSVYSSEMMEDVYSRSLNILEKHNAVRGSRIGIRYAEAFTLLQEVA